MRGTFSLLSVSRRPSRTKRTSSPRHTVRVGYSHVSLATTSWVRSCESREPFAVACASSGGVVLLGIPASSYDGKVSAYAARIAQRHDWKITSDWQGNGYV